MSAPSPRAVPSEEFRPPRSEARRAALESGERHRRSASLALLVLDLATLVVTVAHLHDPVRFALGLAFGLLVPGWCVVGWIGLRNAALEFSLTMVASFTILTLAAQVLITVHQWHLFALQVVLTATCPVPLALLARRHRPRA